MRIALGLAALAVLAMSVPARAEALRVCVDTDDFRPFTYHEADHSLGGFHIDLTKAMCDEIHATCTFVEDKFGQMIADVTGNKCDFVMAFMGWSAEREKIVDFTDAYFRSRFVYIAQAGKGIKVSPDTFKGKTIVTQGDTLWEKFVRADAGSYAQLLLPKEFAETQADLVSGKADALMEDALSAYEFLKSPEGAKYEIVGTLDAPPPAGEAFVEVRKGDGLKQRLNEALATLRQNGTYRKISVKHLPVILQ
ncbi:MAG TPA: ABC transporter substrate-binding protein [Magnetospirillaceae bacterium]|jgi:polar amino acid transport system substrate-binding protein